MTEYRFKYRDFAEALYDAFIPDPYFHTLENSIPGGAKERRESMLKYFDYSMVECNVYGRLYIPDQKKYGVSLWSKSTDKTTEFEKAIRKKQFILEYLGQNALNTYFAIIDFMSQKVKAEIFSESWYLSIVGVRPSFQGKGLGAGLIHPILQESDSLGVNTYLETFTPRTMKFYERLGYTVIDSYFEPTIKSQYWIMFRHARELNI